jgi:uncharacterized protein YbjT (DUF2867 family)
MSNNDKTILVLGATGRQGGAVVGELAARGFSVKALTRDPGKPAATALAALGVAVVHGNLDDAVSLRRAMEGVDGAFSVQTPYGPGGADRETREGVAVVDAAKAAGVKHLVYSSVGGAERNTGIPHFESKRRIEEHIRSVDIRATILRPVFFMENFAGPAGPRQLEGHLVLRMALSPETRLQMIAVRDIGTYAALAFEGHEGIAGGSVEIAGDELAGTEIARAFAVASGRSVRYERQPIAELESKSAETARMFAWFEAGGYQADIPALRRMNPALMTLSAWLAVSGWKPADA